MTKQLNLRSSTLDAATPKQKLELTHLFILVIMVVFVGKQGYDVSQEWEKTSMQSAEKIEVKTESCLKEYNEKLCNQNAASNQCKELLACIHEKPCIGYLDMIGLASQELNNDFWLPSTLVGLLMLFRVSESSAAAAKMAET
jgi:hypothetical protein